MNCLTRELMREKFSEKFHVTLFILRKVKSMIVTMGNLYSEDLINKLSVYDRLHLVVDYVSGMTDSYAVKVYQELTAMKHP